MTTPPEPIADTLLIANTVSQPLEATIKKELQQPRAGSAT